EQYAGADKKKKGYAGEKDAYEAMSNAVFFRQGSGYESTAIEHTKYFIGTFDPKKPQEPANAMFSMTSIYEKQGDPDALIKHLREYIHRFAATGGADRLVIAYAKIGQVLWKQSCPVKEVGGSCVKIVRERGRRNQNE